MKKEIIPYSRQRIYPDDVQGVKRVLISDFLTTGLTGESFEKKFSKYVKAKFSVGVNSATSALHIACKALGLSTGDYLWTSPNSFVASSNCALYCGSKVDFVDIELENYNIDINLLEKKLLKAKKFNKLPKIIVPVLYAGHPHDMSQLKKLSKKYNFKIIEDASHALGAKYYGQKVGSCKYSDVTVFSMHPVKMITTAEGGIATTNNKVYYNKMKLLRSHGITRNRKDFYKKKYNITYYEQHLLGFNYRLNDIQSSLGITQLKKINLFLSQRRKIKKFYDKELKEYPLILPKEKKNIKSSWHIYPILVDQKKTNKKKDHLLKYLRKNNILANTHYIPIPSQPFYKKLGFKEKDFKNSLYFYKQEISLPIYVGLSNKKLKFVISKIKDFFKN
tara:strand:- start:2427 stop:3599 length:1173 start_codon:yes stop_codon:yes gene_type:complete